MRMKYFISFFIAIIFSNSSKAQTLVPKVDQRVEMLSIVARLADYTEYNQNRAVAYVAAIRSWFDPFQSDSLIGYARRIRKEDAIGFDAVMSMAVHLQLQNNEFTMAEGWKESLDKRWKSKTALHFTELLNDFYKKSNAAKFFLNEQPYYNEAIEAFGNLISKFNQAWYYSFYGVAPEDRFNIVIGPGNGGNNYGPGVRGSESGRQIYAIMGSWTFDENGNPVFPEKDYLQILIHEFNHSFINPLTEKYKSDRSFRKSGEAILKVMKEEMDSQAYGEWRTVINESLVRASVILYLLNEKLFRKADEEINMQINRGFLWTQELVELLAVYESNRKAYPTMERFYPEIIKFFRFVGDSISSIKTDYENNRPQVVSIEPFSNNSNNVDTSTKEITIHFSQPMQAEGYSFSYGEAGKKSYPIKAIGGFSSDKKSFRIKVELEPGTDYEFFVSGLAFKNEAGYALKSYRIRFRTVD